MGWAGYFWRQPFPVRKKDGRLRPWPTGLQIYPGRGTPTRHTPPPRSHLTQSQFGTSPRKSISIQYLKIHLLGHFHADYISTTKAATLAEPLLVITSAGDTQVRGPCLPPHPLCRHHLSPPPFPGTWESSGIPNDRDIRK